jgi:hypothetical protein
MRDLRLLEARFDPGDGISLAGFVAKSDPADWESWEWRGAERAEPVTGAAAAGSPRGGSAPR